MSSSSFSTMSMKHARFLPTRVRSNSASRTLYTNPSSLSAFFDASAPPPPPNARLSSHRLPVEARAEVEGPNNAQNPHGTHAPLALASTHAPTSQHPHPSQLGLFFPYSPGKTAKQPNSSHTSSSRSHRRKGPRYTLDIGAYGIPKRGHRTRSLHIQATDAPLAVQVGEDAYFVHENAMGVADGVGGWARVKNLAPASGPSASALFSRRLMHFCADEVDRAAHRPLPPQPPIVAPWETPIPRPYASPYDPGFTSPYASSSSFSPFDSTPLEEPDLEEPEDLAAALEAELDELAEGIDVLNILERAYERTLKAHVVEVPAESPPESAAKSFEQPPEPAASSNLWSFLASPKADGATKTVPLRAGGSTALVAVLDYIPASSSLSVPVDGAAGPVDMTHSSDKTELMPVLKIAHLGDCMGVLVRDNEIVWRSEEMWWRWNTPVQLSAATSSLPPPASSSTSGWWSQLVGSAPEASATTITSDVTPTSAARVFTLPVRTGDILILASDGLGDNLWDEDVLEEVGRVTKALAVSTLATGVNVSIKEYVDGPRLRRQTLAGLLSEALCSRARRVATRRAAGSQPCGAMASSAPAGTSVLHEAVLSGGLRPNADDVDVDDTPFARRARETGREYRGGKNDDISVVVAVIAPASDSGHDISSSTTPAPNP
ncbi:Protein phosphatase [Mycena kentingensis (nom. inval.)]|nr:Protein phosphatase [Mycena kentingensis (nom. inval.)]